MLLRISNSTLQKILKKDILQSLNKKSFIQSNNLRKPADYFVNIPQYYFSLNSYFDESGVDVQTSRQQELKILFDDFQKQYNSTPDKVGYLNEIMKVLIELQLAVNFNEPIFMLFINRLNQVLDQASEYRDIDIAELIMNFKKLNVLKIEIWKKIGETLNANHSKFGDTALILITYSLLQSNALNLDFNFIHSRFQKIVSELFSQNHDALFRPSQDEKLKRKNFSLFVRLAFTLERLGIATSEKSEVSDNLKQYMLANKSDLITLLDANDLSNLVHVLYELYIRQNLSAKAIEEQTKQKSDKEYYTESEELMELLAVGLENFVHRDLVEYDMMLNQYEFGQNKTDEIGIVDNLEWTSMTKVCRIMSDEDIFSDMVYRRLQDAIVRQSETDVIDFESASILLEALPQVDIADHIVIMRILEMIDERLQSEMKNVIGYINGQNLIRFLNGLENVLDSSLADNNIVITLLKLFAGAVRSNQEIQKQLNAEEFMELYMIFSNNRHTQDDEQLIKYLQSQIQ